MVKQTVVLYKKSQRIWWPERPGITTKGYEVFFRSYRVNRKSILPPKFRVIYYGVRRRSDARHIDVGVYFG